MKRNYKTFPVCLVMLVVTTACIQAQPQASRAATAASYFDRGSEWHAKGELERAISDYTFALTFDPQLAPAHFQRGWRAKPKVIRTAHWPISTGRWKYQTRLRRRLE